MVVAFCGHRDVPDREKVRAWLAETVGGLIAEGADEFWLGDKGEFDQLALHVVREFKKQHPQLRTVLVQAYIHQERDPLMYDESMYPSLENVPPRFAMQRRNRYMAEAADVMVTCAVYNAGNAMAIMQYAKRLGGRVINYPDK